MTKYWEDRVCVVLYGGVALFIEFIGGGFFPRLLKRKLDTTPSIHDAWGTWVVGTFPRLWGKKLYHVDLNAITIGES